MVTSVLGLIGLNAAFVVVMLIGAAVLTFSIRKGKIGNVTTYSIMALPIVALVVSFVWNAIVAVNAIMNSESAVMIALSVLATFGMPSVIGIVTVVSAGAYKVALEANTSPLERKRQEIYRSMDALYRTKN